MTAPWDRLVHLFVAAITYAAGRGIELVAYVFVPASEGCEASTDRAAPTGLSADIFNDVRVVLTCPRVSACLRLEE